MISPNTTTQVFIGNSLSLYCIPSFGPFTISWSFNNLPLAELNECSNNTMGPCLLPSDILENNSHFLLIGAASTADSGTYTCSLVVEEEVINSRHFNVTIVPSMLLLLV